MIASSYSYGQRSSTPRSISCPSVSGGIQSTRQPSAMPWPSSAVNSGPRRLLQARGITETRRNSQPTCSTAFCLSPVGRPDLQSQAKDTLKKAENATVWRLKPLIFHAPESTARNFSDGVSRFRRSWLEMEVAVLHTDDGNEVRVSRSQRSKEEELP